MKFTEEQLRRAARRADEILLAQLPDEEECMEHEFSEEFERKMEELIQQVKDGTVPPAKVSMGWRYYVRNGMAAVLLCFLLACVTMPEAVLAGYQKLVEVIETVVTEYTEYRYQSNKAADSEFKPITLNYLPEGMQQTSYRETEASMHILFQNENSYFEFEQRLLTDENGMTYIIDTEGVQPEIRYIGTEEVQLILKDGVYSYLWIHESNQITGQSNLSAEEIMKILEMCIN